MRTRIAMITVAAVMALQFTFAQEGAKKFNSEDKKIAFASANLLSALQSTNQGVIESALQITARMKMQHPAANISKLVTVMNTIWKNHPNGVIRYKAYLAMSICDNPEWFSTISTLDNKENEQFFYSVSNIMREHLLSMNEN